MISHKNNLNNSIIVLMSIFFLFSNLSLKADSALQKMVEKMKEDTEKGIYIFIKNENEIYVCDGKDIAENGKVISEANKTSFTNLEERLYSFLTDKHEHIFIGAAPDVNYSVLCKAVNIIENAFLRKDLIPYKYYHLLPFDYPDREKNPQNFFKGKTSIKISVK